jgi:hypothetical protein
MKFSVSSRITLTFILILGLLFRLRILTDTSVVPEGYRIKNLLELSSVVYVQHALPILSFCTGTSV